MRFTQILLVLHFLGLAMGLSTGFANMVMMGLIAKAAPGEKPVLARFPPLMGRIGSIGLALLWITGLSMLFLKYGGFSGIQNIGVPWAFEAKITLVVLLSGLIGYMQVLERRWRRGDMSVLKTMQTMGKVAFLLAISIIVFAVLAFAL